MRETASGHAAAPWWYRYVRSWRMRMWVETGLWAPDIADLKAVEPPALAAAHTDPIERA